MKILLAIEDSKFSEAAIQAVVRQFRPEAAELRLLHVVELLLYPPSAYAQELMSGIEVVQQERLQQGKDLVARAEKSLRAAGFRVSTLVEKGDPRIAIIDCAAEWNADLIVLGSHGRKGLDRFLLGSVSEFVAGTRDARSRSCESRRAPEPKGLEFLEGACSADPFLIS